MVRLERIDGDIDALIARLAHIRTWTYVAYRADWLDDAVHWQERTRAVEDALSDALHDRLTQRFIDRRTQALLKGLHGDGQLAQIADDGAIVVEGQTVGRIEGLRHSIAPSGVDVERRVLSAAAKRAVGPELRSRAKRCWLPATTPCDSMIRAASCGGPSAGSRRRSASSGPVRRRWRRASSCSLPTACTARRAAPSASGGQWLDGHLAELTMPLRRLQAAELEAPGRGLAFLLVEGLGNVRARAAQPLKNLCEADRACLTRLGVRFGVGHVYLAAMLQAPAVALRARLWGIRHRVATVSPLACATFPAAAVASKEAAEATGYEVLAGTCVRIDVVERLAARLRALARAAPFDLDLELLRLTGLPQAELIPVVEALGYTRDAAGRFAVGEPSASAAAGRRAAHPARWPRRSLPWVRSASPDDSVGPGVRGPPARQMAVAGPLLQDPGAGGPTGRQGPAPDQSDHHHQIASPGAAGRRAHLSPRAHHPGRARPRTRQPTRSGERSAGAVRGSEGPGLRLGERRKRCAKERR